MSTWLLATAAALSYANAQTVDLMCQDTRISAGGNIMGGYVTPNFAATQITFKASSDRYIYGETVQFDVKAGPRYLSAQEAPNGVFLALQVAFTHSFDPSDGDRTGANGEAMGAFHDISGDLIAHPNCASTLVSKDGINGSSAFTGTSHFSWTPSNHAWEVGVLKTTGNATFSLVWANDPAGAGVANPYVYLKTLTLIDGNVKDHLPVPNPEIARAIKLRNGDCVVNTSTIAGVKHTFKGSPVFVQLLHSGEGQTFAAGRCISCRGDAPCKSARITCATEPGVPVIEEVWVKSANCTGIADSKRLVDDIACPGPSHWHVDTLDLDRFLPKLRKDFPRYFSNDTLVKESIAEYRKMLGLVQAKPSAAVVPSKLVDLVWHAHILDTAAYARDTRRLFGHYLHHAPSFGGSEEKAAMVVQQNAMFARYTERYGIAPNNSVAWRPGQYPEDDVWKAQHDPDCCAALCVKPACASCVGCNAIDCGYLAEADNTQRVIKPASLRLAPERFAGYVPSTASHPFSLTALEPTYACSSVPHPKMTLSWSIVDDHIHFKHESKVEAWYAVGLGSPTTSDMGGGVDYMVTMMAAGNYTKYVRDMYKWDSGNGYPCWDILYECSSGNGTAGTANLEDVAVSRDNGYTMSTWNRKLVTGDHKDYDITDAFVRVLYAYGVEDYFTYHGQNFGECVLNFITGESQYCWWA